MAFVDDKAITEFWNQAKAYFTYKAGDKITVDSSHTAGYVTSSKANIVFSYSLPKPVLATSVEVSNAKLILRGVGGNYTHGSAASTWAEPTSVSAAIKENAVSITCTMGDTTNAVNNSPVGIIFSGTITFS